MVVHVLWLMIWFCGKVFISRPVECMRSYNIWILYGKIGQIPSFLKSGMLISHLRRPTFHVSHIVFEMFLYHTFYDFLCRVYTRSVLLGSCVTLPNFLLVFCLTSYSTKGYVSHELFWSIPVSHSVQFFLGLILAISLLCRLVFSCIRKPHPRWDF